MRRSLISAVHRPPPGRARHRRGSSRTLAGHALGRSVQLIDVRPERAAGSDAGRAWGNVMTGPVFPEDSWVQIRYPLTSEQAHGDRAGWPWLPGWIVARCGPDEW
jgi:hypothetical protein